MSTGAGCLHAAKILAVTSKVIADLLCPYCFIITNCKSIVFYEIRFSYLFVSAAIGLLANGIMSFFYRKLFSVGKESHDEELVEIQILYRSVISMLCGFAFLMPCGLRFVIPSFSMPMAIFGVVVIKVAGLVMAVCYRRFLKKER